MWNHGTDPADVLFNDFLPAVARRHGLGPGDGRALCACGERVSISCRLCNSLREATALEAGGSEDIYGEIPSYEESSRLSDAHKAALRYVDALIWSPATHRTGVSTDMRMYFSTDAAAELTFDVMRNASNKIAVAMAADAPRVDQGTARYRILADGSTEYE